MTRVFAGLAQLARGTDLPVQVAAICYRVNGPSVEFLLVNTSSGKWTFPKGRLNPSLTASENASREAWEEAGAKGRIDGKHFGFYLDAKRTLGHDSRTRELRIAAYLFEVHSTVTPEENGRNPSWFPPQEAKKQLADGRSPRYSKRIINIIDVAVEQVTINIRRRAGLPVHAQGRRLATAH